MTYRESIKDLDIAGLQTLLKGLKDYSTLKTKVGKRGVALFQRNMQGKNLLVVEYFPSFGETEVKDIAFQVYKNSFDLEVSESDIILVPKESIGGGVKVYKDDFVVDVSFSKVEKLVS